MSVTSTDWFTAALVVITLHYAVTTHRLLPETRQARLDETAARRRERSEAAVREALFLLDD